MEEYKNLYHEREEAIKRARESGDYEEVLRIHKETTEYNPSSSSTTPEIIKRLRKAYVGQTVEGLNEIYFGLLQKIQQADKKNDIDKLLLNSQLSLGLIEPLIIHSYKHYDSFDIKTIPAIEKGLIYFSVNGIKGQIKNIKDLVDYFNELHFYKTEVEKAFKRLELASKIYSYIRENGKLEQSKIGKALKFDDGRLVSNTIYYIEDLPIFVQRLN